MDTIEAILTRRSIRKYQDKTVPEDVVRSLLAAGMQAPSARDERAWHFVVIDNREILDAVPRFQPYSRMLRQAPLAILVCGDQSIEPEEGYLSQNCSAATQNILLAAHALGLGAVWLGIYPRPERMDGMRQLVGLPENIIPITLISIGYPAEQKKPDDRYDKSKVRHNKW
jgi:nitroreductase